VNRSHASPLVISEPIEDASSSGNWSEDSLGRTVTVRPLRRFAKTTAVVFGFLVGSATAGLDVWLNDSRRNTSTAVIGVGQGQTRRRITLLQARRIALEAMEWAERERLRFAEQEASSGPEWKDYP